jgi:hypothetical protein
MEIGIVDEYFKKGIGRWSSGKGVKVLWLGDLNMLMALPVIF